MSSEGGMWVGSTLRVPGQDLQDSSLHGLGKHTAYLVFKPNGLISQLSDEQIAIAYKNCPAQPCFVIQ